MTRFLSLAPVAGFIAIAIWLQCIHLSLVDYAVDDAYIHFRIAQNLVSHGVPYFNPSDPVFATSSILWTLLLSCVFYFAGQNLIVVAVLNALITLANVYVWCHLGGKAVGKALLFSTPLIAAVVLSVLLDSSVGLMETPLALLLIGTAFLAYTSSRPAASFALLTLAVFTRLEVIVFLIGLFFLNVFLRKVIFVKALLLSLVAAVPLVSFCLYFYGGVIPHAVTAKQKIYQISSSDFVQLVMRGVFGGELVANYKWVVASFILVICGLTFYLLFTEKDIDRLKRILRNSSIPFCIGACGLLVLCSYAVKNVMLASWYMPLYELPLLFAVLIFAGLRRRLMMTLFVSVLVSPFVYQLSRNFVASFGHYQFYTDYLGGSRVRKYLEVGKRLEERYPDARLLTSEIGGLGYGFGGYIIDGVGLVTPEALQYHPLRVPDETRSGMHGSIPTQLISQLKPELVVSLDVFAAHFLASAESENYDIKQEPIFIDSDRKIVGDVSLWGATSLVVAVRKESAK